MKNQIKLLISVIICIQISSCDVYKSKVPISNSESSSINKNWIDKWICLDSDGEKKYPIFEINFQEFNDKEYAATVSYFKDEGRNISSVETFKVYNSKVDNSMFLNIKRLDVHNNEDYFFYKIQEDLSDSIKIRYLKDTLETKFNEPTQFKNFLINNKPRVEDVFLSEEITYYKWDALIWDRVNKENKSEEFEEFYIIGKYDDEKFLKLSNQELKEITKNKNKEKIELIRTYFQKIHLMNHGDGLWKDPIYGVIKMKSGKYLKLKLDLHGPMVKDLTNDFLYINGNKEKW